MRGGWPGQGFAERTDGLHGAAAASEVTICGAHTLFELFSKSIFFLVDDWTHLRVRARLSYERACPRRACVVARPGLRRAYGLHGAASEVTVPYMWCAHTVFELFPSIQYQLYLRVVNPAEGRGRLAG